MPRVVRRILTGRHFPGLRNIMNSNEGKGQTVLPDVILRLSGVKETHIQNVNIFRRSVLSYGDFCDFNFPFLYTG